MPAFRAVRLRGAAAGDERGGRTHFREEGELFLADRPAERSRGCPRPRRGRRARSRVSSSRAPRSAPRKARARGKAGRPPRATSARRPRDRSPASSGPATIGKSCRGRGRAGRGASRGRDRLALADVPGERRVQRAARAVRRCAKRVGEGGGERGVLAERGPARARDPSPPSDRAISSGPSPFSGARAFGLA